MSKHLCPCGASLVPVLARFVLRVPTLLPFPLSHHIFVSFGSFSCCYLPARLSKHLDSVAAAILSVLRLWKLLCMEHKREGQTSRGHISRSPGQTEIQKCSGFKLMEKNGGEISKRHRPAHFLGVLDVWLIYNHQSLFLLRGWFHFYLLKDKEHAGRIAPSCSCL